MSTAAFVTGNVLRRGATRFACKLGETGLMDQMPPTCFDADLADRFQAFDQAEHGGGLSGLRHLLQPGKPAQIGSFPTLCERVEPRALFNGQAFSQSAIRFSASSAAKFGAETLEHGKRRDNDLALSAGLHHQRRQISKSIVFDGLRQEVVR